MSSPEDVVMKEEEDDRIHEPFTIEENIQQLNAIDNSVVQLMNHTATALKALTVSTSSSASSAPAPPATDPAAPVDKPPLDAAAQKQAFRDATNSFLDTLHSVDVRLKRQILALEEAGIVNLSNVPRQDPQGGPAKVSLRPNGVGAVGNLDVGFLNSRGARVERDMESEVWGKAREFLEKEGENVKMG